MAMKHPERLGKYPITGVLGEGAMGIVYKGHDPVIQRPVAIKTIHKALVEADADFEQMMRSLGMSEADFFEGRGPAAPDPESDSGPDDEEENTEKD